MWRETLEISIINQNRTVLDWNSKQLIKHNNQIEVFATRIIKNKKLRKVFVISIGSLMYCQTVLAKTDMTKINAGGYMILGIVQNVGYWIVILFGSLDIIKDLMQGDTKNVGKILMKYSFGYASLYLLPTMMDLIKSIFA